MKSLRYDALSHVATPHVTAAEHTRPEIVGRDCCQIRQSVQVERVRSQCGFSKSHGTPPKGPGPFPGGLFFLETNRSRWREKAYVNPDPVRAERNQIGVVAAAR